MRKLRLTMLGVLCGGLLLIGIGVGVTFTEFTGLSYGGKCLPEIAELQEQVFPVQLAKTSNPIFIDVSNNFGRDMSGGITYQTNEEVAQGTIQVRVAYRTVGPTLEVYDNSDNNFYISWVNWNDLDIFMTMKDEVLQDLKAGQLRSYIPGQLQEVVVQYNPIDEDRVHLTGLASVPS